MSITPGLGKRRNMLTDAEAIAQGQLTPEAVGEIATPIDYGNISQDNNQNTTGKTWTSSDGLQVFNNFDDYMRYEELLFAKRQSELDTQRQIEMDRINKEWEAQQKAANILNAKESLRTFLKTYFFDTEDAFIEDVIRSAEADFQAGLDNDVILQKMQDYENPNSLFAKRFAGNVALRKQGIEPLNPATYLAQERTYREYLDAVGLSDVATRDNFAKLIGGRVAATELKRRIDDVFDIWDSADAAFKSELERTLGVGGIVARNEVAKALLLGTETAQALSRKVATAGVATEARQRGLAVAGAEQLAAAGVTRDEARRGYAAIGEGLGTFGKLTSIYDRENIGAEKLQKELEGEVFLGMQSQRRKRVQQRERAAFSGTSGLSGSALTKTPTAGQL